MKNKTKNTKNAILKTIILFALLCVLINTIRAVGVAPARINFDYEEGMQKEVKIRVLNPDHANMRVVVFAQGELAKYVKIPQQIIELKPSEGDKEVSYTVNIPDKIEKPGVHEAQITIMEIPQTEGSVVVTETGQAIVMTGEGTSLKTVAAAVSQLRINIPYPGKYAEANIFISEANKDEKAFFIISLSNFGQEAIQKTKAKITILSPTNLEIASFETNEIMLPAKEQGKIVAEWIAAVNPGPYHAIAVVEYDGKKIRVEQNFNVGNMMVDVKKIEVSNFKLGDIAKFNIYLENKWGDTIQNVYGEINIKDKQGNELTKFKTAAVNIAPFSVDNIEAYWDTKGAQIGIYDMELTMNYGGKTTKKMIEMSVNLDSIQTSLTPTALVVEKTKSEGMAKRDIILIAAVIILAAINIGWFIYLRKKK